MQANNKQIGGNHYKTKYEHWDFVIHTGQNYLQGCATKYISRWRKKNGLEDLKKSIHYIEKLKENYGVTSLQLDCSDLENLNIFSIENDLKVQEIDAIKHIMAFDCDTALILVKAMIKDTHGKIGQQHPFGFDEKEEM